MSFQTVFYEKATGKIITTTPNKYIKSKFEKARFCPGYTPDEINFLYFPSTIPINPTEYHVQHISPTRPPLLVEQGGIPLVYTDKREKFVETKARYQTIIINMADSMGDNLFRAAAVIEAQKKYPGTRFLCKVQPPYKEVMALCPEITLFSDYKTHNLKPQECGTIDMDGGTLADPRGLNHSKASLYGLFLNLSFAPNNVKLNPPPDPDFLLAEWAHNIGIREDGHNIVFQFRTKNWEGKSWDNSMAIELARMIKTVYDCNVFYLGADIDMTESTPEIINLAGKTTWLQTVYILTRASHVFCIDSGVLHLCRALNIPYFCLWGETHPRQILGEDPGPQDIGAQFETSQGNIKAITPLQVFTRAFPRHHKTESPTYDPAKNYSQHGDQEIIFKYFNDHPSKHNILVDVGAFGRDMSNTYALLELGWKGLLIEANPNRVEVMKKEFANLNCEILNIAISDEEGDFSLYLHSELGHDSLDPGWYPQDKTTDELIVRAFPLEMILEKHKIPLNFDLLSIDTEGWDERIVKHFLKESEYRPALIVTECASYTDAVGLFLQHKYHLIAKTGHTEYGNFIFAKTQTTNHRRKP